ncbi:MAG: hypothetical protein HKN34_10845 [Gammaproteobacteria bacterium]|nr:hypothetical protein [Gammaproteobacteria bacterium]
MIKYIFYLLIFSLLPVANYAQEVDSEKTILYVTDQLRLSLYSESNERSNVLEYLSSGDRLVVEEVSGSYAKVTIPSGKQGWVKRGFLVPEPTATIRLEQMTETNELLKKELEKLNNSKIIIDQYEQDMDSMSAQIETLKQQKLSAEDTADSLIKAAEEKARAEKQRPELALVKKIAINYWEFLAGAALIMLLLGFLIGKKSAETAIRRKFHGIKVW